MSTALLLSGGVDSSVALHILVERGIKPDLFYIRIGMEGEEFPDCPAEEDLEMVHWLAHRYGCHLEIVSLHREYWDYVVRYMIDTVGRGLTPHPDMMCNRLIKFGFFNDYWGKEYDTIATGHYADKRIIGDKHFLATARDPVKDQTDFLAQITYPQLVKALFPLGSLPKSVVREIAHREKLITADRKDSQGICFLGKVNYNDFLHKYLGEKEGDIIDRETGEKMGVHHGYWYHTIGQRKGLGLSGGPWFVVGKDVDTNTLYVSRGYDPEDQYGNVVDMGDMNFITFNPLPEVGEKKITFKVRHTPEFTPGILRHEGDRYSVYSEELIQGIAPGQYCTLYDEGSEICYGSGVIAVGRRL